MIHRSSPFALGDVDVLGVIGLAVVGVGSVRDDGGPSLGDGDVTDRITQGAAAVDLRDDRRQAAVLSNVVAGRPGIVATSGSGTVK